MVDAVAAGQTLQVPPPLVIESIDALLTNSSPVDTHDKTASDESSNDETFGGGIDENSLAGSTSELLSAAVTSGDVIEDNVATDEELPIEVDMTGQSIIDESSSASEFLSDSSNVEEQAIGDALDDEELSSESSVTQDLIVEGFSTEDATTDTGLEIDTGLDGLQSFGDFTGGEPQDTHEEEANVESSDGSLGDSLNEITFASDEEIEILSDDVPDNDVAIDDGDELIVIDDGDFGQVSADDRTTEQIDVTTEAPELDELLIHNDFAQSESSSQNDVPQENVNIGDVVSSGSSSVIEGLLDEIDRGSEDYDDDIMEVFLEEADEIVEDLDGAIHAWEDDSSNPEPLDEILRALHTLKGGARLAGFLSLGDLTHDYESHFIDVKQEDVDDQFFSEVLSYQDKILSAIRGVKDFMSSSYTVGLVDNSIASDTNTGDGGNGEEQSNKPSSDTAFIDDTVDIAAQKQAFIESRDSSSDGLSNVLQFSAAQKSESTDAGFVMPEAGAEPQAVAPGAKKSGPQELVKVPSELLEELVNLAGETSISRSRLEEQVSEFSFSLDEIDSTLQRLQEQLRRLDKETEAQVLFRQEQMGVHEEFDPLEMDRYSHLQQLSRSLTESASDLLDLKTDLGEKLRDTETLLLQQSRINTTLQEGLMRSRMVPFSRLVPRLRRIVRQVAGELGKNVSFELDNIEGELDRTVLERMVPPFEHMLRNAVDHGLESPEDRLAAGKPESGRIVLTLGRDGGDVIIRLADDGQGVDLRRVREKAIERDLMSSTAELTDHDIMQFILHAGFSTAESVTQISGRGVGMDVVHSEIKQLGGSVVINSEWGKGTEFVIRLPFTLSVNRALMVDVGQDNYAIPLSSIEGIVRVSPFELEHYYSNPEARFEYANENYQVRYLGSMLNVDARPNLEGHVLPLPVLLVRSAEHTMAIQVDSLLGSREVVVEFRCAV